MSKSDVITLLLLSVGYLILAIANRYYWYSIWWATFYLLAMTLFLALAWLARELDKDESTTPKDIFQKRYAAGGSVLWLYAYRVCGGKQ